MSARVGLFVAGVQKAGTTSLDAHFRRHPGLAAPAIKETHVFDDETQDWTQPPDARLHAFYPPAAEGILRFEATPITSFWPPALARVQRYNPQARLIIILRDPIDRAWSHWCMEHHRGAERLGFSEAIRAGRARLVPGETSPGLRIFSYVERGFYADQIRRAQMMFPAHQLLFLEFSDLFRNVSATLDRIARFAGLTPFPEGADIHENANPGAGSGPSAEDVAFLRDVFAADARAALALTGLSASHWRTLRED